MATASPVPLLREIGARVRRLRGERGLTSRQVADRAGLSLRFYSQLEGGGANIAIGRLASVARALDVPLATLVADQAPTYGKATVALLGLRGAGKSSLGPAVALRLGLPFVELDERIEETAGLRLAEIFALHGEAYYRRVALDALRLLLDGGEPCVVALPGGIVHDDEAYSLVKTRCTTVWLKARPQDHMDRVLRQGDPRPMADRPNAMAQLRAILSAREPLYAQANVTLDTSRKSRDEAVPALLHALDRAGWVSR